MAWRDLRSLIIEALRASDFDPIMKNTIIIHDRPERAFFLFRKWKGERNDESILKEKWLTFHDHKWLTFKRPLTNILQLHEDLVELGSNIQTESARRMEEKHHINENIYIVFYKITAYAIAIHRAVKSMSEAGWAHITPILLRTMLECMANLWAITNNKHPEYMAFKYLYHGYIGSLGDEKLPKESKEKATQEIQSGISKISNKEEIEKAKKFASEEKVDIYWFKPEEKGVSSIINKYGGEDSKLIYKILSTSTHAGHFGLSIFKDNSDEVDINPSDNPNKANMAIMATCRYLLELLYIRNISEGLGFDSEYDNFLQKILSFENQVRG